MFLIHPSNPTTRYTGVLGWPAVLSLLLFVWLTPAHGLESDRSQPIHVKADSAERDDKNGITTYRGDVVIDQGSLSIAAQEVVMYGSEAITRIVASGRPAVLRQQPDPAKGFITAKGNEIDYSVASETVRLERNAYVEQDGTEVRGDEITYDMSRQIVKANGAANTDGRVSITIPPNRTAPAESQPAANNESSPEEP